MRIVSFLPSATEIIAELDLLDWIVGVSEDCNWPTGLAGKPVVARTRIDVAELSAAEIDRLVSAPAAQSHSLYAVDARLIEELSPELIITQDLCEVCAVSSGDLANIFPIGAQVLSMNPRTLGDVLRSVLELSEQLGVPGRGRALMESMRTKIDAVSAALAGRPRRRVFVAEWMEPPYGSGHWVPEMVEAAGGLNLLSRPGEYSSSRTWEAVLAEEPELIVVAACGFSLEQALKRTDKLRLPVRTVVVDGDAYYSSPAPRLADGVRQLAYLIHPDVIEDPGLPFAELRLSAPALR